MKLEIDHRERRAIERSLAKKSALNLACNLTLSTVA